MFTECNNTRHSQVCKNERARRPYEEGQCFILCMCVHVCMHVYTCVFLICPELTTLCWLANETQGCSSPSLSSGRISLSCWYLCISSGDWTQAERLVRVISPVWCHFSCLKLLETDKHNMTSEKGVQGPLLAFLSQQMRRLEEAGEGRHTLGRRQEEEQAAGRSRLCLEYQSSELLWMGTRGFWRSAKGLGKACLTEELSRTSACEVGWPLEDSEWSSILRAQPVQRGWLVKCWGDRQCRLWRFSNVVGTEVILGQSFRVHHCVVPLQGMRRMWQARPFQ